MRNTPLGRLFVFYVVSYELHLAHLGLCSHGDVIIASEGMQNVGLCSVPTAFKIHSMTKG